MRKVDYVIIIVNTIKLVKYIIFKFILLVPPTCLEVDQRRKINCIANVKNTDHDSMLFETGHIGTLSGFRVMLKRNAVLL